VSASRDAILLDRRYAAVLATVPDDVLATLARGVPERLRDDLARAVGLRAGAYDDPGLGALVRTGLAQRRAWLDAGVMLSEACTEWCIEELGAAQEDPNVEALRAVLPGAIERFGLDAARLMAVQYSTSLQGFKRLMAEDPRFAIPSDAGRTGAAGAGGAGDPADAGNATARATPSSDADRDAKRRARRERQAREREAARKSRGRG
jgi:hypothetical protein